MIKLDLMEGMERRGTSGCIKKLCPKCKGNKITQRKPGKAWFNRMHQKYVCRECWYSFGGYDYGNKFDKKMYYGVQE